MILLIKYVFVFTYTMKLPKTSVLPKYYFCVCRKTPVSVSKTSDAFKQFAHLFSQEWGFYQIIYGTRALFWAELNQSL